jgi:hypothetical protein
MRTVCIMFERETQTQKMFAVQYSKHRPSREQNVLPVP